MTGTWIKILTPSIIFMMLRRTYMICLTFTLMAIGLALVLAASPILKMIINTQFIVRPNSSAYDVWQHFPVTVPMDFYFFNWTNPEDIYNKSVKPTFRQMGPYRFMMDLQKSDIIWNKNGTVTYRQKKSWFYSHDKPSGELEDKVTTPNLIALGAAHVARDWSYVVRKGLSLSLKAMAPTVDVTRSVGELLFEGYPDPLMKIAKTFPFFANTELPPWEKFGWFYERNGSTSFDGVHNMGTGIDSVFGQLYSWNYWTQTPYFKGECGKIDGSTGERFDPSDLDKDLVKFFVTETCRPVSLQYNGTSEVSGIIGRKYIFSDYMLDNGTKYPENKCFCDGECRPSGVFNVSSCRYGLPAFGSLPHFYQADPHFNSLIEGSRPEKDKHEFYIVIEPNTGVVLDVKVRLQINLLMHHIADIALFENIPEVFIPVMWFDYQVTPPPEILLPIQQLLYIPTLCRVIGISIIVVSFSIIIYMFVVQKCNISRRKEYSSVPLQRRDKKTIIKEGIR